MSTTVLPPAPPSEEEEIDSNPVVRIQVNVLQDVANALKNTSRARGLTVTEGVRNAINLFKLISDETSKGNRVVIIEGHGARAKQREIVFL